jgi:hypothetical protein
MEGANCVPMKKLEIGKEMGDFPRKVSKYWERKRGVRRVGNEERNDALPQIWKMD